MEATKVTNFLESARRKYTILGKRSIPFYFIQTRKKWNGAARFHHTHKPNTTLVELTSRDTFVQILALPTTLLDFGSVGLVCW
jgi:hypothetical protein